MLSRQESTLAEGEYKARTEGEKSADGALILNSEAVYYNKPTLYLRQGILATIKKCQDDGEMSFYQAEGEREALRWL